jgi:hypothetical protein
MKAPLGFLSIILIVSLLIGQCYGFGTGSHFDVTRTVLNEHGFRETPIQIAQVENWLIDYYSTSPTYSDKHRATLEKLHFDNLFDEDQVRNYWAILIRNLKSSTERAAEDNDQMSMLVTLGIGLHAVQDFYSHSNWAELHPPRDKGEFRADTFLAAMASPAKVSIKGVHTGKYPDDRTAGVDSSPAPVGADLHGGYHTGLNKDSPMRPHWDEAFVFAYAGSHELVGAMEVWAEKVRPGFWKSVREYAVDGATEKKLNKDVFAARNLSMWLEGKGQDGIWKGQGSGSARRFAQLSSKWVLVDSSVFVEAVREGRIKDELSADLYTKTTPPEIPPIEPFSLQRTAVLIKVAYVAESKKSKLLKSPLSPLGGPDHYSRITAAGQEFWGRTIQQSRYEVEPWYEIFIVDRKTTEIPVTISVWDEDDIDSVKDEHIDINPAAGLLDLKMVFRVKDSSLSGDINGIFNSLDKVFSSEGKEPEKRRAAIRAFIAQRLIR